MIKIKLIGDESLNLLTINFVNKSDYLECSYANEIYLNVIYLKKIDLEEW